MAKRLYSPVPSWKLERENADTSQVSLTAIVVQNAYTRFLGLFCALAAIAPLFLVLRTLQKGMLAAYDRVRTRVGETLSAVSESLMGTAPAAPCSSRRSRQAGL